MALGTSTSTLLLANSRSLLMASSHQWKPVLVGACVASSRIIGRLGWFQRRLPPIRQPFLRHVHVGAEIKHPQNPLLATCYNINVPRIPNTLRNIGIAVLGGFSTLAVAYLSHVETIPYSKRTHLVLFPRWVDMMLGETCFENLMEKYEDKILEETHPTTERVTLIAEKVIDAMERGLRDNKAWKAPNYALMLCKDALKALWLGKKFTDECSEIDWQVFVVDDPDMMAYCSPDGVIVVHTGLLDYLESDAEIAAVIGHEVTHVVARHVVGMIPKIIKSLILELMYTSDDVPKTLSTLHHSEKLLGLCKRNELEADYVGMLLMASAGYDPRAAVTTYDKLAKLEGAPTDQTERFHTHPSGKKRVKLVIQAQEEAMALYKESISTRASTVSTQQG